MFFWYWFKCRGDVQHIARVEFLPPDLILWHSHCKRSPLVVHQIARCTFSLRKLQIKQSLGDEACISGYLQIPVFSPQHPRCVDYECLWLQIRDSDPSLPFTSPVTHIHIFPHRHMNKKQSLNYLQLISTWFYLFVYLFWDSIAVLPKCPQTGVHCIVLQMLGLKMPCIAHSLISILI